MSRPVPPSSQACNRRYCLDLGDRARSYSFFPYILSFHGLDFLREQLVAYVRSNETGRETTREWVGDDHVINLILSPVERLPPSTGFADCGGTATATAALVTDHVQLARNNMMRCPSACDNSLDCNHFSITRLFHPQPHA